MNNSDGTVLKEYQKAFGDSKEIFDKQSYDFFENLAKLDDQFSDISFDNKEDFNNYYMLIKAMKAEFSDDFLSNRLFDIGRMKEPFQIPDKDGNAQDLNNWVIQLMPDGAKGQSSIITTDKDGELYPLVFLPESQVYDTIVGAYNAMKDGKWDFSDSDKAYINKAYGEYEKMIGKSKEKDMEM